jgi:hypothetical protein
VTQDAQGRHRLFPNEFDDAFVVGTEPGSNAFFGLNVLQGLVDGMDDFIERRQSRNRTDRSMTGSSISSCDSLIGFAEFV